MVRMALCATVLAAFLLNIFQLDFICGARIGRRKVEVIHKGRPLQDLVILDSRITPHDLEYLNAFVKPKLLEDSKAEGIMLQKNGIEDFRPLDVTLESEEYPSNNVQYQDDTDQTSNSDNSNENGGLDMKNMPEYKSETKADFKANQEAIDWMMKDPNDFNVRSYEDSSLSEDTDNLGHKKLTTINNDQDETENSINSNLHQRNYGSKRHHAASDSGVQDDGHHTDDTLSPSNEVTIGSNGNRHRETKEWNDNDSDKENDFQSDDLQDDNVKDGTDNARYEDLNKDRDENYNSQETSMKNLNQRIRNQDANLFKELENFQNVDNDVLGNVDEQHNGIGNFEEDNEGVDDHNDESNSHEEDKISVTNEKNADETDSESENKDELENENASESERRNKNDQGNEKENEKKTNENEVANESQNDNDSENRNDNGNNKESEVKSENESKSEGESGSKVQGKSENKDEDNTDSKSNNKVQNDDNDGNSVPQSKKDEKDYLNGQRETTAAEDIFSDQRIIGVKTNNDHTSDKLQRIKERTPGKSESHKEVNQSTNESLSDESFVRLEERITNEIKEFMSLNKQEDSASSKQLKEPKLDSNSESENHISMKSGGKGGGRKVSSPTAEIVGHSKSDKLGQQEQHIRIENDKGHNSNEQNVVRQEEIITDFSNADNERHADDTDTSIQRSKASSNETSTLRYHDQNELVITDEPLISAGKTATVDEKQLFHHKEKQIITKDKENPETTHDVGFNRPGVIERTKAQRRREKTHNNHGNERPTTTGFRRNQPMHSPSSSIFSLADALKIQNIVSYLRATTTSTSLPTEAPSSGPNQFSLKSLYYYPVHPTPQEQPEDNSEAKSLMFSEWNEWSICSVTCGKGTSVRARVCLLTSCPEKDLFQTKSCQKSICADDLERESLEEHNELRAKHFSPPLLWSQDLARKAQAIAERLATKDFLTLNDLQEPQGESLAQMQYSDEHLAKKAIDRWYSEKKSYSFSYPKINPKTRHFVQIVWKETKEMGLAVAKSPNGNNAFVVALYNPPLIDGNRHLRQNVLRPGMKNDLYSTIKKKRGSAVNVLQQ